MGGWLESTIGQVNGSRPLYPQVCGQIGCVRATPFYHNVGRAELESRSAYGEVYYDAIPDELKFTAGARFTQDIKSSKNRICSLARAAAVASTSRALRSPSSRAGRGLSTFQTPAEPQQTSGT